MLINLKNNLHWILFMVGLAFYFVLLANAMLSWSIVWLLFILYAWLIVAIGFQQYIFKHFLYLLCFAGMWVSITWFFIKGIEEIPIPEGAFLFKVEGVIPSIILFILFTIPLILYHSGSSVNFKQIFASQENSRDKKVPYSPPPNSDNWEEATIEDLETGDFESI